MEKVLGDLTLVTSGLVAHQVNCQQAFGAGLAESIRNRWPSVYAAYMSHNFVLGQVQLVEIESDLYVANCAGQDRYGKVGRFTDYAALRTCMEKVKAYSEQLDLQIYLPVKIGAGLGGGDWGTIFNMLEEVVPNAILVEYRPGVVPRPKDPAVRILVNRHFEPYADMPAGVLGKSTEPWVK